MDMFFATRKKGVLRGVFRGDRYKHIGQGFKMAGRGICGGVVGNWGNFRGGVHDSVEMSIMNIFPFRWQKKSPRLK